MDVTVTTEKLSSAFLVIAEHLPVIIVANSSDVSGTDDIHTVGATISVYMNIKTLICICKLILLRISKLSFHLSLE